MAELISSHCANFRPLSVSAGRNENRAISCSSPSSDTIYPTIQSRVVNAVPDQRVTGAPVGVLALLSSNPATE
jgi:hypothetical protein